MEFLIWKKRERGGRAGQQGGRSKVRLGLGAIEGRDREKERH